MEIQYQYLRPEKAKALEKWVTDSVAIRDEPAVLALENAVIYPLRRGFGLLFGKGGVLDENGEYIPESGIPGRVEGTYPLENPEYRDEKVVYCGYLVNHWGHFLIEGVTRLWYFLENDPTVDKFVYFVDENEEREIKGNFRRFLELLGIWDRLEILSKPVRYRQVLIPELGIHMRSSYTPKLLKVFDTVAENITVNPDWKADEKIYFSRSRLKKAGFFECGGDLLDDFFARNGYTLLYPETLPLDEMVFRIRGAKIVASLSGSLPHNMLFAKNGQTLEIVERLVLNIDNQVDVNRIRNLNVTCIDAHYPIYPVDFTGPIVMGYTPELTRFAEDRGYQPPDGKYLTDKYKKQCFVHYMKAYSDLYRYNWFEEDWYAPFAASLYEGFRAGHAFFGEYLDGKRPFRWHHYLEFHYWKQFVKKLLIRNSN